MRERYIVIDNEKIVCSQIFEENEIPENGIKVPLHFVGGVGMNINLLSDDFSRFLTDEELIEKGIYFDKRGLYSNGVDFKEIKNLNEYPESGFYKIEKMPDLNFEIWDSTQKKFVTDTEKKKTYLQNIAIAKIKSEAGREIESTTFEHNGKIFSCGVIAQTNYMGLKTAIDSGIVTLPSKCWSTTGEESVITDETDLSARIGKLFAVVYPIREKANADENEIRQMTLTELENL